MMLLVGAYGLGVEKLGECRDDLVIELGEFCSLCRVHVVNAAAGAHGRSSGNGVRGCGVW